MPTTEAAAPRSTQPTWRDELTPLSRASRRRWVLAYALLLVLAAVYFGSGSQRGGGVWLPLLASLFVVFGMLRRGTRRLAAIDHPDLDERDAGARERAFRLAYPLLLAVFLVIAVVQVIALPDAKRPVGVATRLTGSQEGWFLTPDALLGLSALATLWALFLPTAVLAWIEPDSLTPDPGEPTSRMGESRRDALLAATLVACVVVGLISGNPVLGVLPLLLVVSGLGHLARDAAPGPPASRTERSFLILGLVLAPASSGPCCSAERSVRPVTSTVVLRQVLCAAPRRAHTFAVDERTGSAHCASLARPRVGTRRVGARTYPPPAIRSPSDTDRRRTKDARRTSFAPQERNGDQRCDPPRRSQPSLRAAVRNRLRANGDTGVTPSMIVCQDRGGSIGLRPPPGPSRQTSREALLLPSHQRPPFSLLAIRRIHRVG